MYVFVWEKKMRGKKMIGNLSETPKFEYRNKNYGKRFFVGIAKTKTKLKKNQTNIKTGIVKLKYHALSSEKKKFQYINTDI